ncbi:MAG: serine protease AprX [Micromonosporaceae bacterium]|nr:serine protease AprX [Micromonosporaceae bacterium]
MPATPASAAATTGWIWDTTQTQMASVAWTVGADAVWSKGITGKGIGVALIDTGTARVDGITATNIVNGPDLSFESQDSTLRYRDKFGHGTHLAGIIAGRNTISTDGFSGIAPGVKLTSIKIGVSNGATDVSQAIAAVDWAVDHRNDDPANPIRVINLAYGTDGVQDYKIDPLAFAVENAWRKGIVVVAAAGNAGSTGKLTNPAYDPYVVTVGAADTKNTTDVGDDRVASFSSRGTSARPVDLVAPGRSIVSLRAPGSTIDQDFPTARSGTRFFRGSGTSQASAVVTGAVALMLQARPSLTPDSVKNLLKLSARYVAPVQALDTNVGMLNVWDAFQWVIPAATQTWTRATGAGSLEKSRGTVHVVDNGVTLTGERTILGAFDSKTWAVATAAGTAWAGGDWTSQHMVGSGWATIDGQSSWTGRTWSGDNWAGRTWSGRTWSGRTWSGLAWVGYSWY